MVTPDSPMDVCYPSAFESLDFWQRRKSHLLSSTVMEPSIFLLQPEFTTVRAVQPPGLKSDKPSLCWTSEVEKLVTLHCHEGSFTIWTFTICSQLSLFEDRAEVWDRDIPELCVVEWKSNTSRLATILPLAPCPPS